MTDLGPALFWMRFHAVRNLRKPAFRRALLGVVGLFLLLRFVANARIDTLGEVCVLSVTPLLALFFGTGVLREEIEDQTLTYGFTRPVGRGALFAARVLASAAPVLLLAIPVAVLAGLSVGPETAARFALGATLGCLAYLGLFALAGVLFKQATWFGLFFLLFWEQGVSRVPGFLGQWTLSAHIRALAGMPPPQTGFNFLSPQPTTVEAMLVLLVVTMVTLGLGGQYVRRREFALTGGG